MGAYILGTKVQEGRLFMIMKHAGLAMALGLGHASVPAQIGSSVARAPA